MKSMAKEAPEKHMADYALRGCVYSWAVKHQVPGKAIKTWARVSGSIKERNGGKK